MNNLTPKKLDGLIFVIRGKRVMLDSDLADLYEVETRALNQQVKRNITRFPEDFCFQLDSNDLGDLRSQIVTAKSVTTWNHKRRGMPYAFTELGVSMLSSVLSSEKAIQVNISIMRAFVKIKNLIGKGQSISLEERVGKLEEEFKKRGVRLEKAFELIFQKLDQLEGNLPSLPPSRKKIGIAPKKKK